MLREWVTGPRGEYVVLAGTSGEIADETEPAGAALWAAMRWGFLLMPLRRAIRRASGRGRVEVRWRDDDMWAWTTGSRADAIAVAATVSRLLRSGEWVPYEMPQPDLPAAEPEPVQ